MEHDQKPQIRLPLLIGVCLLSSIGVQFQFLFPVLLGAATDQKGFSPDAIGILFSATTLGILLSGLSSPIWLRHINLRAGALITALLAAASLAAFSIALTLVTTIALLFLHGLTAGALYVLCFDIIAPFANPERTLGTKYAVEPGFGLIMVFVVSNWLLVGLGFAGATLIVAALLATLGLASLLIPSGRPATSAPREIDVARLDTPFILAMSAVAMASAATAAMWIYSERLGMEQGFSISESGNAVAAAGVSSVLGGAICAAIGDRFGHKLPFLISALVAIASTSLFLFHIGYAGFLGVMVGFTVATTMVTVFCLATVTILAPSPRYAGLGPTGIFLGGVVGPLMGGFAFARFGREGLVATAVAGLVIAITLFVAATVSLEEKSSEI